jgi:hypothetical protein
LSIYEKLQQSIKESQHDKYNNSIKWVAQFNETDDYESESELINLGIRKEGHLYWIYFSFDINDATLCASSEEEIFIKINNNWGKHYKTFKWI